MSITVIAHFCNGYSTPFPASLCGVGIAGEGSCIHHPEFGGGVIIVAFDTLDAERVIAAFEEHLKDNDLTALALHRTGETSFFYSKTNPHLF